jgi:hypothetical protein
MPLGVLGVGEIAFNVQNQRPHAVVGAGAVPINVNNDTSVYTVYLPLISATTRSSKNFAAVVTRFSGYPLHSRHPISMRL